LISENPVRIIPLQPFMFAGHKGGFAPPTEWPINGSNAGEIPLPIPNQPESLGHADGSQFGHHEELGTGPDDAK
jgi:hypothetical protein